MCMFTVCAFTAMPCTGQGRGSGDKAEGRRVMGGEGERREREKRVVDEGKGKENG